MNIEIRRANHQDIDKGLLEVFKEGYFYHHQGRPDIFLNLSDAFLRLELIKSLDNYHVFVLVVNNVISGYIAYVIKSAPKRKIHIEQLVIKEDLRGKGYGKMLMNYLENVGKENNCERVELDCWIFNKNAINMYEHLGYEKQRIIYEKKL